MSVVTLPIERSLTNAEIGELLCLAADGSEHSERQRRALRRAGRAAFRWPEEASALLAQGRSLTELRWVGPWLAHFIRQWITEPPDIPTPPAIRRGFLTRPDVDRLLQEHTSPFVRGD